MFCLDIVSPNIQPENPAATLESHAPPRFSASPRFSLSTLAALVPGLRFGCSPLRHAPQPLALIAAARRAALVRHRQPSGLQACPCVKVCHLLSLCVVSAQSCLTPAATNSSHFFLILHGWHHSHSTAEFKRIKYVLQLFFFHCVSNNNPKLKFRQDLYRL